jgi:DNA-binding response OmpR family regulator
MTTYILLVEDEVKLARFVELELSREGYQVSVLKVRCLRSIR